MSGRHGHAMEEIA